MKIMKTETLKTDDKSLSKAAEILKSGGIVAIPTETVYGLAANAFDCKAIENVFNAKGRPQDNPLIVHIASLEELPALVDAVDPRAYDLAAAFWPGPLTIIMKKSDKIPLCVTAGLDTVAIRMPLDESARNIIKKSGVPLAAPSANASGRPSPTKCEHVLFDLDGKINAVVDGGECSVGLESTVITLATNPPTLLRPGGITVEQLESVLGEIQISHAIFEKLKDGEKPQSPGMKYKHYSPKTSVTIVKSDFENYKKFILSHESNVCAVCFEGEGKYFNNAVEYGKADDSLSQAQGFFNAMRLVDTLNCTQAFVRCPSASGVGLAVYNRLLRSAAFKEIDLNIDMEIIGITGQTGAGKSTIAQQYVADGYYLIDADALARQAVTLPEVIEELKINFGEEIFIDGKLCRKALANKAFSTPENTKKLNSITHPTITRLAISQMHEAKEKGYSKCILDAPLLNNWCIKYMCKKVVVVTASLETRISRIILRDNITREMAIERINAQPDEAYYIQNADEIIKTD